MAIPHGNPPCRFAAPAHQGMEMGALGCGSRRPVGEPSSLRHSGQALAFSRRTGEGTVKLRGAFRTNARGEVEIFSR